MPLFKIQSNKAIENADQLILQASKVVAELLNKPEKYVMVSMEINQHMSFGGTMDPLLYCELKSIGLPGDKTSHFSQQLMAFLHRETGIDPERIYIEFADARRNMWGWNSATFE